MVKIEPFIYFKESGCLRLADFLTLSELDLPDYVRPSFGFLQFLQDSNKFNYSFHTSGSTGIPKQIIVDKEKIKWSVSATVSYLQIQESKNKRMLVALPTTKIAGAMQLARAFYSGHDLILLDTSNRPLHQDWLLDFEAFSLLTLVPHQAILALEDPLSSEVLKRCEVLLLGGAQVPNSLIVQLEKTNTTVYETYGMTETVSHVALKRLNPKPMSDFFEGISGVQFSVTSEDRLMIKGTVTDNKWMLTDDVVLLDSEGGKFKWLGRYSNVINTGGVKLFCEEIEEWLLSKLVEHGERRLMVYPVSDDLYGQRPALVCEGSISASWLEKLESLEYPKYFKPVKIDFLPSFPLTDSNKMDRLKIIKLVEGKK